MAKYCPVCKGFFLYENSRKNCPDCGRTLEVYRPAPEVSPAEEMDSAREERTVPPPFESETRRSREAPSSRPVFLVREGSRYIFRGAVFHVDTLVREYGFFRKIFYSVFSGEPFQPGRVSYLTNIRLEEHTDTGFPEQSETVIYYGDIESQLATGDDIQMECIRHRGRYMAERVYSFDHNRSLTPESIRLSPWLIRALFVPILLLLLSFAGGVVYFFVSGAFLVLLSQLMLPLLLIGGLWFWFRSRRWR